MTGAPPCGTLGCMSFWRRHIRRGWRRRRERRDAAAATLIVGRRRFGAEAAVAA